MSGASPSLVMGGSQAFAGIAGSLVANKGIRKAKASARESAQVEINQTARAAALARFKSRQAGDRLRARIRVLSSSAGTGVGGSVAQTLRQADLDEAINLEISRENQRAQTAKINSQLRARNIALSNQQKDPLLSGLTSGLQGVTTGLMLETSMAQLDHASIPIPTDVHNPRIGPAF